MGTTVLATVVVSTLVSLLTAYIKYRVELYRLIRDDKRKETER